jgi:hypothetical protein
VWSDETALKMLAYIGKMNLIEFPWEGVDWIGRVATCNELSGSKEGKKFLQELLEYRLLKQDSV